MEVSFTIGGIFFFILMTFVAFACIILLSLLVAILVEMITDYDIIEDGKKKYLKFIENRKETKLQNKIKKQLYKELKEKQKRERFERERTFII